MELEYIDVKGLEVYGSLLLPEIGSQLRRDEPVTALGLSEDGVACGAVALWPEDGFLELRSLYVDPAHRRRGGGTMLVRAALELAKDECRELYLCFENYGEALETLPPFLQALGFTRSSRYRHSICFTLGQLFDQPFFAGRKISRLAVPFSRLGEEKLREIYQSTVASRTNYMSRESFLKETDQELSMVIPDERRGASFVAISRVEPELMEISWVRSTDPRYTALLLQSAFAAAEQSLPPETRVSVQAVTPASQKLMDKLLPMGTSLTQSWTRVVL